MSRVKGLGKVLEYLPRTSEVFFYIFISFLGLLCITGGEISIQVADTSPTTIPIQTNIYLGIVLILFGQWGFWVGPRLQKKVNEKLRLVIRFLRERIG